MRAGTTAGLQELGGGAGRTSQPGACRGAAPSRPIRRCEDTAPAEGVETTSRNHRTFLDPEHQGVSNAAGTQAFRACGVALVAVVPGRSVVTAGRLYEDPVITISPSALRQTEIEIVEFHAAALGAAEDVERKDAFADVGQLAEQEMPAAGRPTHPDRDLAQRLHFDLADRTIHGSRLS